MGTAVYRIRVNEKRCIGCGLCEESVPEVFAMGDFSAYVKTEYVDGSQGATLSVAARDCPVNAISIIPDSGDPSDHHDEKGEDEEERGEIRQYKREDRD